MADRIVVMDHGHIVQVGTAVEIYRTPATPFVADFVGTMNFLPGVVLGPGRLALGRIELDCKDSLDGLAPQSRVTVCVRPEDLRVGETGHKATNTLRARVEDLEFLGAFYRATLVIEGLDEVRLRADFAPTLASDREIRAGGELTVVFPEDRMQVFAQPPAGNPGAEAPPQEAAREAAHG